MILLDKIKHSQEWLAIVEHYGNRKAERSQVPLIKHIEEGIHIIDRLPFSISNKELAAKAFCLHPIYQNEGDLYVYGCLMSVQFDSRAVLFAMEYRWRANNWLSDKVSTKEGVIRLEGLPDYGSLPHVKAMLIADKVQNYKDFLRHHKDTHPRSAELEIYFRTWLDALGVGLIVYNTLTEGL